MNKVCASLIGYVTTAVGEVLTLPPVDVLFACVLA